MTVRLPVAPPGFRSVETDGAVVLIRVGYEPNVAVLSGVSVPASAEWVTGGRVEHALVALDGRGERALVRAYRRGGFIRHFNRDRYFLGNRAFDELRVTERARRAGVRVPLVLAATQRRTRFGYTAVLSTLWLDGVTAALPWMAHEGDARAAVARSIGGQIARMHAAGISHPDLNLKNVLVSGDGTEVSLVDFDRAACFDGPAPPGARVRDILRFARSARRLGVPLDAPTWEAIRSGYGPDWPLGARLP